MSSLFGASVDAELAQLAERVSRSVVRVQCRSGGGSGVVWRADGLVITNAHVVRQRTASLSLWDGRAVKAQLCGYDSSRDLAALQIEQPGEAGDLIPIATGDAKSLRVGQLVFALGNPHGEEPALSAGIIHAVNTRRPDGAGGWVQADVAIHPGNSGGPLFDVHGAAIGINSMIAYGLALAVPSWAVLDFVTPAARPRIGVICEPVRLQPRITQGLALAADAGLLIVAVSPHSAADKAGLLMGDVITGVAVGDGQPSASESLADVLASATGDDVLRLWILRAGRPEVRELPFAFSTERASAAA